MGWTLFATKCDNCGNRVRDPVPPPPGYFRKDAKSLCKACHARDRYLREREERWTTLLQSHHDRLAALGDPHTTLVHRVLSGAMCILWAGAASRQMFDLEQGRAGTSQSSVRIASPNCYSLCTLAMNIDEARQWYRDSNGGYLKYLAHCWDHERLAAEEKQAQDAKALPWLHRNDEIQRADDCYVLCQLTFGCGGRGYWVNLSIIPIQGELARCPAILATDLMTQEELAEVGHMWPHPAD